MDSPAAESRHTVAFFCATFLEAETHHIYRQIASLQRIRPLVLTQKQKNADRFPWPDLVKIPRSSWRFVGRFRERHLDGHPWQISHREADAILAACHARNARALHIFFGNTAIHLLPLYRRADLPIVTSFHGADVASSLRGKQALRALREVFSYSRRVACRSESLRRELISLGCPSEKIRIQRTLLPGIPFVPRNPPSDGTWRIVQAGRLIPKKGYATSLRAFSLFRKTYPRAEFIIAGDGPLREELQTLARELGIENHVHFLGFLSQQDLLAEYGRSHIFLHPSETFQGDQEGIPNAMLEAMATGLPPVATFHAGIPEVVEQGRSGWLVSEKSPQELAEALLRIADQPVAYSSLSENASGRVRQLFMGPAAIETVENVYLELESHSSN